jgi:hypothetical protein
MEACGFLFTLSVKFEHAVPNCTTAYTAAREETGIFIV